VTNQLKNIKVPTLITCGRYDEVTPKNSEVLHKEIRGSKLVIFEKSAHHMSIEEPEKWMNVHREFLDSVSAKSFSGVA
jgi:proline iminopeptidase